MIYWVNIVILFGSFLGSALLFLALFGSSSVIYELSLPLRMSIKAGLIMLCVGQLHAIEGDKFHEIHLHDLFRDLGQLTLIWTFYLLIKRK